MSKAQAVGRLALRVEGENWNAYYAQQGTMEGAIFLGSIRMALVRGSLKEQFMDLMQAAMSNVIEDAVGERPTWDKPQSAPENERSGSA